MYTAFRDLSGTGMRGNCQVCGPRHERATVLSVEAGPIPQMYGSLLLCREHADQLAIFIVKQENLLALFPDVFKRRG